MTERDAAAARTTAGDLPDARADVAWVPIAALSLSDSPRLGGEHDEHTRMLAEVDADLPPIIVQQGTNRVIDGRHRVRAALLRGQDEIAVRYFTGEDKDAFVLAVRSNVTHGLPLPHGDRRAAANRILQEHPQWSDREISRITGLATKTVAAVRREVCTTEPTARIGRDGRVRPLSAAAGRLRAQEFLRQNPNASLREISAAAGISVGTARDVRRRVQQEDSADVRTPATTQPTSITSASSLQDRCGTACDDPTSALRMLRMLRNDPSLRYSESGRLVIRMLAMVEMEEPARENLVANIPDHCIELVARLAAVSASLWQNIVVDLGQRSTTRSA